MRTRTSGAARVRLRDLLSRREQQPAFPERVVDELVREALIQRWDAGDEISSDEDQHDLAPYCIAGPVKVMCPGPFIDVALTYVSDGGFVPSGWLFEARPVRRRFRIVAHTEGAVIASWSQATLRRLLTALPSSLALEAHAHPWRMFSQLARIQCVLRALALHDRILVQLRQLAPQFGRPEDRGTLIDLALTHEQLGELVVASRASVTKTLRVLRMEGLVIAVQPRFILTPQAMASDGRGDSRAGRVATPAPERRATPRRATS